jgi:hypothetical protein
VIWGQRQRELGQNDGNSEKDALPVWFSRLGIRVKKKAAV